MADCTSDGTAIVFELESESGTKSTLACPVDGIAQFIATLSAAAQKAAALRGEGQPARTGADQLLRGLTNPPTTVGYEYGMATLSIYPQKNLPLHFGFSPDYSRQLSAQLADAAAMAEKPPH